MRRRTRLTLTLAALFATPFAMAVGCSSEESSVVNTTTNVGGGLVGGSGGNGAGATAGNTPTGGNATGGNATGGGVVGGGVVGGGVVGGGGGAVGGGAVGGGVVGGAGGGEQACAPAPCYNQVWECGDCQDNDGDGLVDSKDPDCLGPCHNNEAGFSLEIPGGSSTNKCRRDCYYDDDSGAGNDDCYWDLYCDPTEPQIELGCEYDLSPPANCADPQTQECLDVCLPLVPNGCDCFGCCELPAESGQFVYIGSESVNAVSTCTLENILDEALCHDCVPVLDCVNTCGHCELCLGKTELPADCFGTGGNGAGGNGAGGNPPDQCPENVQPCGLPGQDPCPAGAFCLTGCCRFVT